MLKHRGEILKKVFEEHGAKVSHVAKKIKIDRGTVYRHFEDQNLSFDYLIKYGQELKVDFSKYFPEMISMTAEVPANYGRDKSYADLQDEVSFWKDKYINLLERYNELMFEKLMKE